MSAKLPDLPDELAETAEKLRKKYGDSIILSGKDIAFSEMTRVSTGSFALDVETGGGFPCGRIVEVWGRESSGKTTLALHVAANVQRTGRLVAWIDIENAYDPVWAKKIGVDTDAILLCKPNSGDEAAEVLEALVRTADVGLIVLDSLAVLVPNEELEKSVVDDRQRVGDRATLIQRMTRRVVAALNAHDTEKGWNQTLVLCLNQVTEKIGQMWGSPDTAPGGRAIPHAASIRVKLQHGGWIEFPNRVGEKERIGHIVKFQIMKNKTAAPGKVGEFSLYTAGPVPGTIDNVAALVKYGQLYDVVKLSGRTYTYGEYKAVGKEKFATLISSDDKLLKKLRKEVLEAAKKL